MNTFPIPSGEELIAERVAQLPALTADSQSSIPFERERVGKVKHTVELEDLAWDVLFQFPSSGKE